MKIWGALGAVSLLVAGCGSIADDEGAPAQVRQAVTSAVNPIAAGRFHSLAVRNGTVWAWGSNGYGQLGDGTTTHRAAPVQVQGLTGTFVSVAAGENSSLALRNDGTVWGWGYNAYGQLGDGTYDQRTTPVQVHLPAQSVAVAIAMDSSGHHALALLSNGTVWAWGYNAYGQVGDGTSGSWILRTTPVQVQVQTTDGSTAYLNNVVAIATGMYQSLAVRNDGTAWAWGINSGGELGDNTTVNRSKAVQVQMPTTSELTGQPLKAVDVSGGMAFSLVLADDGTVYSFGSNSDGKLGYGTNNSGVITPGSSSTPHRVGTLTGITRIEGGKTHGLAMDGSGTIWGWGDNSYGQLGPLCPFPTKNLNPVQSPLGVGPYAAAMSLGAGDSLSIAMDTVGAIWTWGYNNYGQLGRSLSAGQYSTATPATVTIPSP